MVYRQEIDGLRALAVIPVILYHAGLDVFSGGFVGVDIFFVISGYLITSIILAEMESGVFTLSGFYERRMRRILPALFFVLLVSLPFAWFWLLPHEIKDFGRSIMAVALFSSNILFWKESGYFATDAEFIPLLHTWSLGVEEQFYVIFPLLIMLFWFAGKRNLVILFALVALSGLALAEWGWRHFPEANFYLIPSRAWELMLGALTAFYLLYKPVPTGRVNQWASLLGMLLILGAIFGLDKTLPFPGLYALLPTLGSVLIILFAHSGTVVHRLLSFPLWVGIGLISYSAYLWHFPVFVFTRIRFTEEPGYWLIAGLLALIFGLAYMSWRFIEAPLRDKRRFTRKQVLTGGVMASLAWVLLGWVFMRLTVA